MSKYLVNKNTLYAFNITIYGSINNFIMLLFLVRCSKTFYTTISNQSINYITNQIPIFAYL